ncbi:MAG: septal ring lytic transglycosylase RlpA family protein [Cellvibrionales bacterium]|nr:septal ring lytic transglycosylase RlpA family protein [Cellvibrionales bacterium]
MAGARTTAALLIAWLLGGCASQAVPVQDGAPHTPVDLAAIESRQPHPVTRTRAGNSSPYSLFGQTYEVLPASDGFVQEGLASWYGRKFHGRPTATGEPFDMHALTAAHRTLPLPTYALVTNLENGQSEVVRINDRGPFHAERIIDLSWAAAAKLGFAGQGTARVRVVALDKDNPQITLAALRNDSAPATPTARAADPPPATAAEPAAGQKYYQIAAFAEHANAAAFVADLEHFTKFPVQLNEADDDSAARFRVLAGPLTAADDAHALALRLKFAGIAPGFIVQLPTDPPPAEPLAPAAD